jgi:catechol 2,3-dioxygenase-like lactoylglutathione lyase family enzyme
VFDHVTIRASDRPASQRFYATVLAPLGVDTSHDGEWYVEWRDFSLAQANDEKPPTRGLHVGFVAASRAHVDAFWRTGVDAGYRSDGEPGPRPQYSPDYYGGFLVDPDGNSVEAVHHGSPRRDDGVVDHLWIRVADLEAARRFYELVGETAGYQVTGQEPGRVGFGSGKASFSIVEGPPTEELHLAFPSFDRATVDDFHAALVGAGYRDNGAPGERPIYHAGYYGAFVLDPDGNNVELVFHDRRGMV